MTKIGDADRANNKKRRHPWKGSAVFVVTPGGSR